MSVTVIVSLKVEDFDKWYSAMILKSLGLEYIVRNVIYTKTSVYENYVTRPKLWKNKYVSDK
jgi:putative Mn2+ efflux pump MntP